MYKLLIECDERDHSGIFETFTDYEVLLRQVVDLEMEGYEVLFEMPPMDFYKNVTDEVIKDVERYNEDARNEKKQQVSSWE